VPQDTEPSNIGKLTSGEQQLIELIRQGTSSGQARREATILLRSMWPTRDGRAKSSAWLALLALAAGLSVKFLMLLGGTADHYVMWFGPVVGFWVLLSFAHQRHVALSHMVVPLLALTVSLAVVSFLPFAPHGSTTILTAIHLPVLLWMVVTGAVGGGVWQNRITSAEFVRLTGSTVFYLALLAAAGGLLTGLGTAIFLTISPKAPAVAQWLLPIGVAGAVVVASWLAETDDGDMARIANTLRRAFVPLFTALMLAFAIAAQPSGFFESFDRSRLGLYTVLLVVVCSLVGYAVATQNATSVAVDDWLLLALAKVAVIVDVMVLYALFHRLAGFGITPNRAAVTGLNLILLIALVLLLMCQWLRLRRQVYGAPQSWLGHFISVIAVWAALVTFGFPLIFAGQ
jgi:hypothetical protein